MDPRRVLTFRAVAHQRSFSRAARELALSQPSVSNQVGALEREIGVRLFDRRPGGLGLTHEGEILLEHADAIAERFQLAGSHAGGQVVAAFVDADLGVGVALAEACNGGGYEPGERGRERADAQPRALCVGGDGELRVGELEALGDGVGVLEQDRAGGGEREAAGVAVDQPRADLAFEQRDLVGDRRL